MKPMNFGATLRGAVFDGVLKGGAGLELKQIFLDIELYEMSKY
jgi:hypothetical protein